MARRTPWVVALTGGVASGKSAVARRFEALGVNEHDADVAARAVVEPGTPALAVIAENFGAGMLLADGTLDRRAMRAAIFDDADARRRLEAIVHPRVHEWLRARVDADTGAYCVLAIPLLAETWPQYAWVDRVLLVDAADDIRIQRLMQRDGIDRATAGHMLAAQATHAQRVAIADDIIDNNGREAALDTAVAALHQRYLALANAPRE
jgi:dephospho-CoA kinase